MPKILIPASSPVDWKELLAEPEKHRRQGYSAHSFAYGCQEADGIPQEILRVLGQLPSLHGLKTVLAIPEHQVPLPRGTRPAQHDVCALGETENGLVSIAVEVKMSEPFGPTVREWFSEASLGKEDRLQFLYRQRTGAQRTRLARTHAGNPQIPVANTSPPPAQAP